MTILLVPLLLAVAGLDPCDSLPSGYPSQMDSAARVPGNFDRALRVARAKAREFPGCPEAHFGLALVLNVRLATVSGLAALGVSREYKAALERTIALAPTHLEARTEQVQFLIHAPGIAGGNRSRARTLIQELEREHPLPATRLAVELARAQQDSTQLAAALERLVGLDPGDVSAHLDLGQRLIVAGRYAQADTLLLSIAGRAPDDRKAQLAGLYLRGRLRVLGRFELVEAVRLHRAYLEGIAHGTVQGLPPVARGWLRLGEALEASGNCAEASAAFGAAQRHDPKLPGLREALKRSAACSTSPAAPDVERSRG